MTDNIVTLRLVANADGVVTGVRLASGEVGKLGPVGQQAGAQASAGLDKVRASAGSVEAQLARAKTQFVAFLGAAQVAMVLRGMVGMSDEISNINGRLKLATRSEAELATAKAAVFAISQRTNTELASTASLYARLAQSAKDYGISQQRQLALTETINKTFAVSGATAEAQKNTITQFTQSLAGGVLRAEEFNSVIENSPRLAQALADGMGISMGKLRAEVNAGQVSVERLLAALESQADVVAREFAQMPITVERAWTNLRNAVTQTIGDLSAELGAGSLLANGIEFVAEHLGMIGNAVALLAAAVVGRLVSATAAYLVQQATQILQARAQAQAELAAARAAEVHAAARVALGRAGMLAGGQLVAAENALATAQARTAAATQAASLALTAKAGAMRVLNGVMAAFGGPVGVAVTALALFVSWLVKSRNESKQLTEELNSGLK
ncbi:MAG TPA: tape measure protein, partial [Solimonas sp.]